MTTDAWNNNQHPTPPIEPVLAPWSELPHDPDHPGTDGSRLHVDRHWHTFTNDRSQEFETIRAAAVFEQGPGVSIELGPWSMTPHDARVLAASLTVLADAADRI